MTPNAPRQEFAATRPDRRKAWLLPGPGLIAAGIGMAFAARDDIRARRLPLSLDKPQALPEALRNMKPA